MCMFCAAIPATLAVGINIQRQQKQDQRTAEMSGDRPVVTKIPVAPLTALAVVGLAAGSVIYHSTLSS